MMKTMMKMRLGIRKGQGWIPFWVVAITSLALSACINYQPGEQQQDDPEPDTPPYHCTQDFAESFDGPLQVTDGHVRLIIFSANCRFCLTVDETEQRLRVSDLETCQTVALMPGVDWAGFAADETRVLFTVPEAVGQKKTLFVARGDEIFELASTVDSVVSSPEANSVAWITDLDQERRSGTLHLASLTELPPAPVVLGQDVIGAPAYAQEGKTLLYLENPQQHSFESENISCSWDTSEMRAHPVDGGTARLLGNDVLVYGMRPSADGQHVWAGTDYDCQTYSQTLKRYPLGGQPPWAVADGHQGMMGGLDFIELPSRNLLLHAKYFYENEEPYRAWTELWVSPIQGGQGSLLASDMWNYMMSCMLVIPFQPAGDGIVVYIQNDTRAVLAVDLNTGDSWPLVQESDGYTYAPAPDGSSLLNIVESLGRRDLLAIPIRGGEPRILAENLEIYDWASWNTTGERVLLLTDDLHLDAPRSLKIIHMDSGEITVLADDIPDQIYGKAYQMSPGGWMTAIQRSDGLHIVKIP